MLPSKNKAYQLLGQSTVYALTAYTNENLKMHRTREGVWKKYIQNWICYTRWESLTQSPQNSTAEQNISG